MSWARRVYEADKVAAGLCTDMQRNGFAFDIEDARRAADDLRAAEVRAFAAADAAVGRPIARGKGGGFSTTDLGRAFHRDLRAPIFFRSELTGNPKLDVNTLRAYTALLDPRLQALAHAVLEQRRARKIRSTYIESIRLGSDGRVHPTWLSYGTVSGRWSCQAPNIMNLPRKENDPTVDKLTRPKGIRSLFMAKAGSCLVTFDCSQLEMRVAAYASGDEAMIRACESSDLHATNAQLIFGAAFDAAWYALHKDARGLSPDDAQALAGLSALRTLAKSAAFAVCYMAEAETVYARILATGTHVTLRQVTAMLRKLREGFHDYFRWQDRGLLTAIRKGYVESPILGRRRWVGHEPSPTECANFPIQGGAADVMSILLPAVVSGLRTAVPSARLVAQVHDSGVFEAPQGSGPEVIAVMRKAARTPVRIASSGKVYEAVFPIDTEESIRWH